MTCTSRATAVRVQKLRELPDTFQQFHHQYVRLVYALAISRTGGDRWQAEDLAQETFVRAWQHFDRLEGIPPAAQKAWLARTLRNLAIDSWRRRSREVCCEDD